MAKKRKMDYYTKMRLQAFGIIGVTALAMAGLVAYAVYDDMQWSAYATENDCKVIAKTEPTTGWGFTSNGKVGMVFIDARVTFHCADGVDYTR